VDSIIKDKDIHPSERNFWKDRKKDESMPHLFRNSLLGLDVCVYPDRQNGNYDETASQENIVMKIGKVTNTEITFTDGEVSRYWVDIKTAVDGRYGFNAMLTVFRVTVGGLFSWNSFLSKRRADLSWQERGDEHRRLMDGFRQKQLRKLEARTDDPSPAEGTCSTAQDQALLDCSFRVDGVDREEVLAENWNIQLRRKDLQTLAPGIWLNDNIVNYWLGLLRERDLQCKQPRRTLYIDSYLMTQLSPVANLFQYSKVES
jgi:hypothetical protein